MSTYIIDDNKLYREDDKGLYVDYVLCMADKGDATPRWTGPKIPFEMFREMTAWCEETQRRLKSEAMVLLFLDEDNQWKCWYCPQITSGMSVESDDHSKLYIEQRKLYPDRQLGTLHHHCDVSAFQSGTDSSDEDDRDGLHFTIGDLDSKEYSLHARFCINGESHECLTSDVVAPPDWVDNVPEGIREEVMDKLLAQPTTNFKKDHFKELIEQVVEKKTFTHTGIGGYGGGYHHGYAGGYHGGYSGSRNVAVAVSDAVAVTRLIEKRDAWWPLADAMVRTWITMSKTAMIDIDDIIFAVNAEMTSKTSFSKEYQAFATEIRKCIKSPVWVRPSEFIEYLEEIKNQDEEDAMVAAAEEKEAQFTEEHMLQIDEHLASN